MVDFRLRGIPCWQQKQYDIPCKAEKVGDDVPDLIAYEKITDCEIGQKMNHLKVTGLRLGYLLNVRQAKLEWKRVLR